MNFLVGELKLEPPIEFGSQSELFIVEGDSAAKAVIRCRCPSFQGVLPMQGKPLNAWKASPTKVENFELFRVVKSVLGADWGDNFALSKVRFGKVLLLFDPDADGIHCGALMALFFLRWMRPLIEDQRIEVVHAPLVEITCSRLQNPAYAHTEEELQRITEFLKENGVRDYQFKRFRGLANLDSLLLSKNCVAPNSRKTSLLTLDDAQAAVEMFGG